MSEHSRTVTWGDPLITAEATRDLSGREFLERLRDGELPVSPLVAMMGIRGVEVDDGRVVFAAEIDVHLFNGIGIVHGGFAATILDTAIGCAVISKMPRGRTAVTLDLSIRYFKPLTKASGDVRCEGTVINLGRTTATGEGKLYDAAGRLHAHAMSTLALVDSR